MLKYRYLYIILYEHAVLSSAPPSIQLYVGILFPSEEYKYMVLVNGF